MNSSFYFFLLTILIITLIFVTYYIQMNLIYFKFPFYNRYKVIENLLNDDEINTILSEGIDYGMKNGWTQQRHDNYPTTDNVIDESWKSHKLLNEKCNKIIFKNIEQFFWLIPNKLTVSEFFMCKYENNYMTSQSSLEFHEDQYEFSFVIALNDDYSGGGTIFEKKNITVKLKKGDCLIFCGQTRHGGKKIINGTRYIVSGFLKYGDYYYNDESDDESDDE